MEVIGAIFLIIISSMMIKILIVIRDDNGTREPNRFDIALPYIGAGFFSILFGYYFTIFL